MSIDPVGDCVPYLNKISLLILFPLWALFDRDHFYLVLCSVLKIQILFESIQNSNSIFVFILNCVIQIHESEFLIEIQL